MAERLLAARVDTTVWSCPRSSKGDESDDSAGSRGSGKRGKHGARGLAGDTPAFMQLSKEQQAEGRSGTRASQGWGWVPQGWGTKVGLLRVGEQKWGFSGFGNEKGAVRNEKDLSGLRRRRRARQGSPRAPLGRVTLRGGYNLSRLQ